MQKFQGVWEVCVVHVFALELDGGSCTPPAKPRSSFCNPLVGKVEASDFDFMTLKCPEAQTRDKSLAGQGNY